VRSSNIKAQVPYSSLAKIICLRTKLSNYSCKQ